MIKRPKFATATRGERNNNPGNIDRNKIVWQGMSKDQTGDKRFVVYDEAKWGIRAIKKTLLTYFDKHGLETVREIIDRWAPPVENSTYAYVDACCDIVGVGPDSPINLRHSVTMLLLVKAIIKHENGRCIYSDKYISDALALA